MVKQVGVQIGFHFQVFDGADSPKTGLVNGNFTKRLARDGANVASPVMSVAEVGNGRYYATFTPDAVGVWQATVSHTTWMPRGVESEYQVTTDGEVSLTGVAAAVWAYIIETGFSALRVLKIIAAACAGKSTGGRSSFTARNLGDTENAIVGSADENGNRTPTSYAP